MFFGNRTRSAKIPTYRWDYRWDDYPGKDKGLRHPYDQSVMTYKGHQVLRTLIRCYFSPMYRFVGSSLRLFVRICVKSRLSALVLHMSVSSCILKSVAGEGNKLKERKWL